MRWIFWRGERNQGRWGCTFEPPGTDRKGACCQDTSRQKMRNCPRKDLGHAPFETNPKFDLALGRTFRVYQCPVGLITDRSMAFLELFFDCHTAESGWSGTTYRQICWPTAQTLFDEYQIIVQTFRIIREEIASLQAEQSKDT